MTRFFRTIALAALGWSVLAGAARADSFDAIYAFGDSLSDGGNVYSATGIPASPPYYNGEFSNGPVWVQGLATGLGLAPLTPSLLGGTDYAYGSGETAPETFNTSNVATDVLGASGQLAQYEGFLTATSSSADPSALYTIWIGSNDLADIYATGDPSQFAGDVATVAGNIDTTIGDLALLGAKNFLVLTAPDAGLTPLAAAAGPTAQANLSSLAAGLNSTLVDGSAGAGIPSLADLATTGGVNIQVLDTYLLLDQIVSSPATYGFTNVTDPCLVGATPCATPGDYLFWDDQHPTEAGQGIIAADALTLVTPEPVTFLLSGLGLVGVALLRRRVILSADGVAHF